MDAGRKAGQDDQEQRGENKLMLQRGMGVSPMQELKRKIRMGETPMPR
jgi:hypothetical protein